MLLDVFEGVCAQSAWDAVQDAALLAAFVTSVFWSTLQTSIDLFPTDIWLCWCICRNRSDTGATWQVAGTQKATGVAVCACNGMHQSTNSPARLCD